MAAGISLEGRDYVPSCFLPGLGKGKCSTWTLLQNRFLCFKTNLQNIEYLLDKAELLLVFSDFFVTALVSRSGVEKMFHQLLW